ncbi:riboflavin synthase alpha chain [Alkalithermobacter thermoalcaliphilus JW-YL-7 = DSM 7308]|uniref:Riboflavin synthase n=1 Tax=Alkalithermobacter thermoalcaliphilus JW-YL-7 = DSM 7308 TaxID=1121328 RepID=A0A150FSS7_CLOPD|nr:riboflavin synthase, alpha subunit [[Clostridium] paradoxum JW-YL-7 = DSM 7308]SHL18607.1 riboflavin synthase alpha chain [[Clostridium] paradoxum JW-YL-7 = DSM 7308]
MFTGLVEEIGIVESIENFSNSSKIVIKCNKVLGNLKLGDSISTNGVCLTVTNYDNKSFSADVMGETIQKTNLKYLKKLDKVNLERALKLGDRFGGHIVTGHIDGIGTICDIKKDDIATWISINANENIMKYIIYKGSVCIDGISLTVACVEKNIFKVSIIPHTKTLTTLSNKNVGDFVNIECDIVGKYIEKLLNFSNKKSDISLEFLKENGFL